MSDTDTLIERLTRERDEALQAADLAAEGSQRDADKWAAIAAKDSARAEAAEAALASLDDVFAWLAENYPAAMREMPTDLFQRIAKAGAALTGEPRC